jgi:hypothetical protein
MDLHRPDITLLDRTKIQAEVLVPLYKAMERQLGTDAARSIMRDALSEGFRQMARDWLDEAGGDTAAAFIRFGEYSSGGDPLVSEFKDAPPNEIVFDVTSCQYAQFFQELGEPDLGFLLVCSADQPIAEEFGVRLERSHTIMQGASRCDFRYIVAPHGNAPPPDERSSA